MMSIIGDETDLKSRFDGYLVNYDQVLIDVY